MGLRLLGSAYGYWASALGLETAGSWHAPWAAVHDRLSKAAPFIY